VATTNSHRTVLITGGTGLLGQGLLETVPPGWSIVSVHLRAYDPGAPHGRLDVRDRAALQQLFEAHRFDAVVHAAGIASVDISEQHVNESTESNLGGTRNLVELCAATGTRMVYVSTNAVFDGESAPYGEADRVNPINAYGRIKLACERVVQEALVHAAVVRPILMYGWPHAMGRPNPVTWVVDSLTRGERINVVDDVYENPLHNIQAASAVWRILEREVTGIIHLAGGEPVNRYQLALAVARAFELDASPIRPVPSSFFPHIAPRPRNTTLRTTRMERELGMSPSRLEEGLGSMVAAAGARR
jgi:dTDP-4-dehydrorhamnose reductase